LPLPKLILIILIVIWTFFWKAVAMWHAVKRNDKKWFIAILVINTFSLLELVYLFYVVKIKSIKLN
jgi:hypothetical protein